jgi:outer membrane biosynthesis protein TonB
MRLDYVLYGLGIIFFALSVASYAVVAEPDGQLLYVISTALLGVLSIGAGFVQRPKAVKSQAAAIPPMAQPLPPTPAPTQVETPAPVVSQPVTEPTPQVAEPIAPETVAETKEEATTATVEVPTVEATIEQPKAPEPVSTVPATASVALHQKKKRPQPKHHLLQHPWLLQLRNLCRKKPKLQLLP